MNMKLVYNYLDFNLYPLPDKFSLQLKERHIKIGKASDCHGCPLAIATAEYLQIPALFVWVGSETIVVGKPEWSYSNWALTKTPPSWSEVLDHYAPCMFRCSLPRYTYETAPNIQRSFTNSFDTGYFDKEKLNMEFDYELMEIDTISEGVNSFV